MKKITAISEEMVKEEQQIRGLLADRQKVMRRFPPTLEFAFWQSMAERSISMMRQVFLVGMLVYLLIGLITFPTIYLFSSEQHQLHDILIWLLLYLNGAVCLLSLPVLTNISGLTIYFKRQVIAITFFGVFFTSFLTVQYETPRLVQGGSYIMALVYMLVYFLTGVRPLTLLLTSLVAGVLPLIFLGFMQVHFDAFIYFYSVFFSNVVGFLVGHTVTSKERFSFLQGRLLAIDKIQAELMSSELARLSNEDSLTGLFNRRYFNEAMAREWERSARTNEPLSVIFVDIDYFKNYNDTYGHQQGDAALTAVAKVLQQELRRSADIVARYGGEEFILLLPNTPLAGAQVVASNISKAVDHLNMPHRSSQVANHLTLSIGVSTWSQEPEMDAQKLIAQADQAVYQAKEQGRHTICVYAAQSLI